MIGAALLFPVLILSLYGIGEYIRFILLGEEPFSAGKLARALGFGIIFHGLLMTLLGFIGLLHPLVAAILTAIPAIILYKTWYRDLLILFQKLRTSPTPSLNPIEIVLIALIALLMLVRLFNAFAPNISWDATSHHYLVPSEWLKTGLFHDMPSVVFSYYPSLIEAGIVGTMALANDFLSNLYGWIFGALAALSLVGIGMRHFDGDSVELNSSNGKIVKISRVRMTGIIAAFLFTVLPGVGVQTSGGYVDLPLACFTLLAADMVLEYSKRPFTRTVIAAGLFAGAVLSTKHTGLIAFIGLLILLIWILNYGGKNQISSAGKWKSALLFIGLAILIPLPWYILSLIHI